MTKNKSKKWIKYSKPILENSPIAPVKILKDEELIIIGEKFVYRNTPIHLNELPIPEGVDWKDLKIELIVESDYDGDCDYILRISNSKIIERENLNYKKEFENYKKRYDEWKIKKDNFQLELKEWKKWVKSENEKFLEMKIEYAKNLLKKHGMLK